MLRDHPRISTRSENHYFEIFLLSFAVLLVEISYTRIFSFKLHYFFTYFIIGIALLGLGAGGVFVAIFPRLRRSSINQLLPLCSISAGASLGIGYVIIAVTQVNSGQVFGDFSELLKLVLLSLGLFVPFLLVGIAIASLFAHNASTINRLYFADMLGGGLACLTAIPFLSFFSPPGCVMLSGVVLAAAGTARVREKIPWLFWTGVGVCIVLAIGVARPGFGIDPVREKEKQFIFPPDAPVSPTYSSWSPVFRVDAIYIDQDTRIAVDRNVPRPYFVLEHDGLLGSAVLHDYGSPRITEYLRSDLRRIPFAVTRPESNVLIIGAAGGHEIAVALQYGAESITAVELNPVTYRLMTKDLAEFSGGLAHDERVTYLNAEGRTYLARDTGRYDLIYYVAPDSYSALNAATAGAFVLSESYLYTVEAIIEAVGHLSDGGVICMQFGEFAYDQKPNRTARFSATAREAFRRLDIERFEEHIVVLTSGDWIPLSTVLLKKSPFTRDDLKQLDALERVIPNTRIRHAWDRTLEEGPVNTVITLDNEQLADWHAAYSYDVRPVVDDKPFFWHFARFRDVPLFERTKVVIDKEDAFGERVLLLLLGLALTLGLLFLLLPFVVIRAEWRSLPYKRSAWTYFAALGLGFMFYEVSLIQKFTLLLGYPTYSLSVTLMATLVFAGVGSIVSGRYRSHRTRTLAILLLALAAMTLLLQFAVPPLVAQAIGFPLLIRMLITVSFIAPLALCLGGFLPLGLVVFSELTERREEYIAWNWAVNGFFSVTGSVLATILSMVYGFNLLMLFALVIYGLGALTLARVIRRVPIRAAA